MSHTGTFLKDTGPRKIAAHKKSIVLKRRTVFLKTGQTTHFKTPFNIRNTTLILQNEKKVLRCVEIIS